jgi:hypothetical protein
MESRRFEIRHGAVNVICDASWNAAGCEPGTYFITLVRERSLWFDKDKGTMGFPAGKLHGATWDGLDSGDYYLQIWMSDHDPRCVLNGNIKVST